MNEINMTRDSEIDVRKPDELASAFDLADNIVKRNYLSFLDEFKIIVPNQDIIESSIHDQVRLLNIRKLVYKKNENNLHKLTNVYTAASEVGASVAMIINSEGNSPIEMCIGICGAEEQSDLNLKEKVLFGAMKGNFTGSFETGEQHVLSRTETESLLNSMFTDDNISISSVSAIPAMREDEFVENDKMIQGIDRVIEAMSGESFSAVFIANSITTEHLNEIQAEYENLYSKLSPFLKSEMSYNASNAKAISETIGESFTKTIGTAKSSSLSIGTSNSSSKGEERGRSSNISVGLTQTNTESTSHSESHAEGITKAAGAKEALRVGGEVLTIVGKSAKVIGAVWPPARVVASVAGGAASAAKVLSNVASETKKTITDTITDEQSFGSSLAKNRSYGYGRTSSVTNTITFGDSENRTTGESENESKSKAESKSTSDQLTETLGKTIQISYENRTIKNLLDQIEKMLERIENCKSYGFFASAVYFIGDNAEITQRAASTYKSIISGSNTSLQTACINNWNDVEANVISKYLKKLRHPVFVAGDLHNVNMLTPATMISGQELAIQMGLPYKSVNGIPVLEIASFGRNLYYKKGSNQENENGLALGKIYNMGVEEQQKLSLNKKALAAHTFITGSTGSGKSNTIYTMLKKLCLEEESGTKFLVIEPAKGEYKETIGGYPTVTVYGTNPFKSANLLQINPFSFPDDVHVLEHIDRLVEVFNACWPMYAAMPAILKESVERAYEECGWNLRLSKNPGRVPNFDLLLDTLPKVIESSAYSADTSSDYKGALVTRVRSLTRGIHGQIFENDINGEQLFNENVIVDISRIGSQETKALIMGILILKLQEFRMSEGVEHNSGLRHITVLEEAHNILRRSSSEQSQESSNLQGKSVEMLANAIAEMRTYGEGFIIADQSPGLLDMSVIRNTNTKIIMRLPDEGDRELVGKAAGLNEEQIVEISKLETGVAAVYQSGWIEPVLCKIGMFNDIRPITQEQIKNGICWQDSESEAIRQFLNCALDIEKSKLTRDVVDQIRKWSKTLKLSEKAKYIFENVISGNPINGQQQMVLLRYCIGESLCNIPEREEAILKVESTLISKYGVDKDAEMIQSIRELFFIYFPLNVLLENEVIRVEHLVRKEDIV